MRLAPSSMLSALATYTYTDARFRDYEVGPNDFRGHRIPGLAPHRLHGALEVSPGPLYGMLSVEFVDAFPANDANTFDAIAPAYWRSDLRVGLDGVGVGQAFLTPYLAILNLTDEHYSTSVSVNALDGRFFEPGPGRRVQLGVRAGFGGR